MSPAAASCRNGVTPAYPRGGGERRGEAPPAPRYPQGIAGSGSGAGAEGGTGREGYRGGVSASGGAHGGAEGCSGEKPPCRRGFFPFSPGCNNDRYVAICKPLHYGTLLGSRACAHMAAAAWASGFLNALLLTANTFSLPLCHGNALGQFFCEIPQILKLSCSHSKLREIGLIVVSACLVFGCFIFIVFSYVQIFRAVLRIPSEQGRHKAFSTCLPHLAVVTLFISTSFFAYLKPPTISSPSLDLVVAVLYSVVPPALNPFIYSLRNKELKDAVRKIMT
ncbi:olfactory receptor 14J1-like [Pithys albifrons albifrons]|uniref:olfactory receptor 14J1-like n=1 Tax=Pithys albifrons albifrons TaxID=3385563 RepID=UPI003A5CD40D